MTTIKRSRIRFAALLSLLLVNAPAFAADESSARDGAQQVESGAKHEAKDGAASFGHSVKNFFTKLFNN